MWVVVLHVRHRGIVPVSGVGAVGVGAWWGESVGAVTVCPSLLMVSASKPVPRRRWGPNGPGAARCDTAAAAQLDDNRCAIARTRTVLADTPAAPQRAKRALMGLFGPHRRRGTSIVEPYSYFQGSEREMPPWDLRCRHQCAELGYENRSGEDAENPGVQELRALYAVPRIPVIHARALRKTPSMRALCSCISMACASFA